MTKDKKIKYDFSNPESQKLFEEFTYLLADITKYVEEREVQISYLEEELKRVSRIRYMVKLIINKLSATGLRFISYLPRKIVRIAKRIINNLKK